MSDQATTAHVSEPTFDPSSARPGAFDVKTLYTDPHDGATDFTVELCLAADSTPWQCACYVTLHEGNKEDVEIERLTPVDTLDLASADATAPSSTLRGPPDFQLLRGVLPPHVERLENFVLDPSQLMVEHKVLAVNCRFVDRPALFENVVTERASTIKPEAALRTSLKRRVHDVGTKYAMIGRTRELTFRPEFEAEYAAALAAQKQQKAEHDRAVWAKRRLEAESALSSSDRASEPTAKRAKVTPKATPKETAKSGDATPEPDLCLALPPAMAREAVRIDLQTADLELTDAESDLLRCRGPLNVALQHNVVLKQTVVVAAEALLDATRRSAPDVEAKRTALNEAETSCEAAMVPREQIAQFKAGLAEKTATAKRLRAARDALAAKLARLVQAAAAAPSMPDE